MQNTNLRLERDSMGTMQVPQERLWGAQTQRSLHYFNISSEKMDPTLIRALILIKKAAAMVNEELKLLDRDKAHGIIAAADKILGGAIQNEFPLSVWQTGSGTQTNMNVNEVLANLASEILGGKRGPERLVHPNDDVNLSQSSNDVFPTAMNIACLQTMKVNLLPAVTQLRDSLNQKALEYRSIIKIGRTHLMDATPISLGQEISGWVYQLDQNLNSIQASLPALSELALGGTAVGTGLNAPQSFSERMVKHLSRYTGLQLQPSPNKFAALAGHDALLISHGTLRSLATALFKIANDVRWLASGPRCGIGELHLPKNEPGSSIMPGKVNPTQCEAMTMVCAQVIGNDVAMGIGGASGNFELNVYKPLLIHNFLQSVRLLSDASRSFDEHCIRGLQPNVMRIQDNLEKSLMLVTALAPHLGYDRSAEIAKKALAENKTLKQSAVELRYLTAEEFDSWVRPMEMTNLRSSDPSFYKRNEEPKADQ
jgi:fumarate hydratase class II